MLQALDTISIGRPVTRGPITLYPLYLHAEPAPAYRAGPDASAALTVEEVPAAEVPTLVATVTGDVPVLLVEGEAFLGGRQDRVLNTSVLLGGGRTEVPVSCVEAGRWHDGHRFARAGWHAPSRVRSTLNRSVTASVLRRAGRHADQSAVWADVDRSLRARTATSPTAALREAMARRTEGADPVHEAAAALADLGPLPGQTGVVAAVGSRLVTAQVFDKASTLAAYWAELVASLAADVDGDGLPGRPPRIDAALRFVRGIRHGRPVVVDGVGLGRETRLVRSRQVGSALEWNGALVHLGTYALVA